MKFVKYFCVIAFAFGINAEVVANAQKVLSAAGLAVNEDIKVEFGEGIGETKDEALKEAIRDVLQRVVGTYVDSDFRVENDKIIKDQIITHSNGFIERYKIMDTDQAPDGRGIQVTIKAWVKIRDFVNRMKGVAPIQRVKVDGLLLNNELENKHSAEKLIQKEFEQLNPVNDLLKASLVTSIKPIVQESTDDSVTLRYIFTIGYSYENYYKKFLPRMMSVLDQVAEKTPQNRGVQAKIVPIKCYPRGPKGSGYRKYFKDVTVSASCLVYNANHLENRNKNAVFAVVKINKGIINIREWRLSTHLKKVFVELLNKAFPHKGSVDCTLRLLDANGCEVTQGVCNVYCEDLFFYHNECRPEFMTALPDDSVFGVDEKSGRNIDSNSMNNGTMHHFDKFVGYIDVIVDRKDIARIKTAEIKLEQSKIREY